MEAKQELMERLIEASQLAPSAEDFIAALPGILATYAVGREASPQRSNLRRRISQFIAAKRIDGLSDKTLRNYSELLGKFAQRVTKHASKITVDDVRDFIAFYGEERKIEQTSLQTYVNYLRTFFSWLQMEGIIRANPMAKIKSVKVDKKNLRKPLTPEELEQLRDRCATYKEKALVEFLVSTGCRVSEASRIQLEDLDFKGRSVVVLGKGNKRRTVYFSVRAKLMIEEYLLHRKGGTALFASSRVPYGAMGERALQKALKKIGDRARVERVHPHKMRHTFATDALNNGMDITVIQRLLGHENLSTTQIYASISSETVRYEYERYVA